MEFCNDLLTYETYFTFNLRYPVELTAITGRSGGPGGLIVLWGGLSKEWEVFSEGFGIQSNKSFSFSFQFCFLPQKQTKS